MLHKLHNSRRLVYFFVVGEVRHIIGRAVPYVNVLFFLVQATLLYFFSLFFYVFHLSSAAFSYGLNLGHKLGCEGRTKEAARGKSRWSAAAAEA